MLTKKVDEERDREIEIKRRMKEIMLYVTIFVYYKNSVKAHDQGLIKTG